MPGDLLRAARVQLRDRRRSRRLPGGGLPGGTPRG